MTAKKHLLPTEIITGEDSLLYIQDVVDTYSSKTVIVFIDPILVKLGLKDRVEKLLVEKNVTSYFYTDINPEPTLDESDRAVDFVREAKADLVIGIGGGSCMDIAKTAATLATHPGYTGDYLNLTGEKKLEHSGVKKVLIPTTAGTGSEVTPNAVFGLGNTKDVISDKYLFADVAIIDPVLTYTMPPNVTASSGMDAFIHAVESYTSKGASDLTDVLALEAIKKIYKNIRRAVWNGEDTKARREMAWGCLIASLSYPNSLCHGVHSLSYPLGGEYKIPHGESNSVLFPYVFEFIWPSVVDRLKDIAIAIELPIENKSDRDICIMVVEEFYHLVNDIGLPISIAKYGITENDISKLARDAIKQTRLLAKSPRTLTLENIETIYRNALAGTLNNQL